MATWTLLLIIAIAISPILCIKIVVTEIKNKIKHNTIVRNPYRIKRIEREV